MKGINQYGKAQYGVNTTNALLAATKIWVYQPTQNVIDSYAPFNHLYFFNYSSNADVEIMLNGCDCADTLTGTGKIFYVPALSMIEIMPEDNILFSWLAIKNLHAANDIAAGKLVVLIQNY